MIVQSARFGELAVPEEKLIRMQKPILGFEHLTTFCLVEKKEFWPFLWLQSVEDPAVAFVVVNPIVFFPGYKIEIHPQEVAELMILSPDLVETYVIVTIPQDPTKMTANLQGPILVNTENTRAKQLVLVNSDYQIQHYILDAVQAAAPRVAEREDVLVGV
jgi:flagellar assembly factor FliW